MAAVIISCLSQKGGVGKSTLARLLAVAYATAGWSVKIADFNTRQLTAVDWNTMRLSEAIKPQLLAESYTQPTALKRERVDLVVADGKPDSDQSSLEIARLSDLIVVPTGLTLDDLKPQLLFAKELVAKGVPASRIIFVLNKTTDSDSAVTAAREYLKRATDYRVAETDLTAKVGYQIAQNYGRSVAESKFSTLNDRANDLAAEIIGVVNELTRAVA